MIELEDQWNRPTPILEKRSKLIDFVMRIFGGSIKNEKQAEYVLFALVLVAVMVSIFLFTRGDEPAVDYAEQYRGVDQSRFIQ